MAETVMEKHGLDMVPQVLLALEQCGDGDVVRFPQGEYHFWPDQAFSKYYYISNNRHGLKRVAFPVIGKRNVAIDGGGSRFVFHGEIVPFVVEDSENIALKNFSVDWQRPFYSQGEVARSDASSIDLLVDREKYPYRFENGRIVFVGEGWARGFSEGLFEMDPSTRAPAYRSGDAMGAGIRSDWRVEAVDAGTIRIHEAFPRSPRVGNVVVLRHYRRCCPGIHLRRSKDTLLEDVVLHHAGGMGVVAQYCENATLRRCRVTPSGDRLFSVTVDATHFVNCRGLVRLEDCLFENQLDDPTNVHGIYTRIQAVPGAREVVAELGHHEQHGVEIAFPGDRMRLADNATLLGYAENEVEQVERIDARSSRIVFKRPLPDSVHPGHVLENLGWTPDLHVSGCTCRNNRARGLLVSTPGRVVVENNRISSSGAAIKICGEANHWFESGAVRDVLVRGNEFGDCCYGAPAWGRAVIDIDPEIPDPQGSPERFHRGIRIEGNRFSTFDTGILFARSVDGIRFAGNTVRRTESHPPSRRMEALLTFEACRHVEVEGNDVDGRIAEPLVLPGAEAATA